MATAFDQRMAENDKRKKFARILNDVIAAANDCGVEVKLVRDADTPVCFYYDYKSGKVLLEDTTTPCDNCISRLLESCCLTRDHNQPCEKYKGGLRNV